MNHEQLPHGSQTGMSDPTLYGAIAETNCQDWPHPSQLYSGANDNDIVPFGSTTPVANSTTEPQWTYLPLPDMNMQDDDQETPASSPHPSADSVDAAEEMPEWRVEKEMSQLSKFKSPLRMRKQKGGGYKAEAATVRTTRKRKEEKEKKAKEAARKAKVRDEANQRMYNLASEKKVDQMNAKHHRNGLKKLKQKVAAAVVKAESAVVVQTGSWTADEKDKMVDFLCNSLTWDEFRGNQKKYFGKCAKDILGGRRDWTTVKNKFDKTYALYKYIRASLDDHTGGGDGDKVDQDSGQKYSKAKCEAFRTTYYEKFELACSGKPDVDKLDDINSADPIELSSDSDASDKEADNADEKKDTKNRLSRPGGKRMSELEETKIRALNASMNSTEAFQGIMSGLVEMQGKTITAREKRDAALQELSIQKARIEFEAHDVQMQKHAMALLQQDDPDLQADGRRILQGIRDRASK